MASLMQGLNSYMLQMKACRHGIAKTCVRMGEACKLLQGGIEGSLICTYASNRCLFLLTMLLIADLVCVCLTCRPFTLSPRLLPGISR